MTSATSAETRMPAAKPSHPDNPEVHAEDHYGVRGYAEECGVPERQQAGIADQQVEAHREDREDQDFGYESRHVASTERDKGEGSKHQRPDDQALRDPTPRLPE